MAEPSTENVVTRDETLETYLQEHLESLSNIKAHLDAINLWNYVIPVFLLVLGLVGGYLLSFFCCKKRGGKATASADHRRAASHDGSDLRGSKVVPLHSIPAQMPISLDPRSPHYNGRRVSNNFPIAGYSDAYHQPDGARSVVSNRYTTNDRYSRPVSPLAYSTLGSDLLPTIPRAPSRAESRASSISRIRTHMERKMEIMEQRHQQDMAQLRQSQNQSRTSKENSKDNATQSANDELEYQNTKNPFFNGDSDDNST